MDIGAIFLLLALLILIALFVISPFMTRSPGHSPEEHALSSLLAENERILDALQELDFDNTLGKIPAEDYPVMRRGLMQQGIAILRKLDETQPTDSNQDPESRLESAVAAHQRESSMQPSPDSTEADEDLEARIARHRSARKSKSAGFCTRCGNPVLLSDIFCPKCGRSLR